MQLVVQAQVQGAQFQGHRRIKAVDHRYLRHRLQRKHREVQPRTQDRNRQTHPGDRGRGQPRGGEAHRPQEVSGAVSPGLRGFLFRVVLERTHPVPPQHRPADPPGRRGDLRQENRTAALRVPPGQTAQVPGEEVSGCLCRKRRIWRKKVSYDCRKKVADGRLRIKGKFVTREQAC